MKYEETWNSLKRHRLPEWLDDAKFGIYMHWGVYSVPAFGNEWYPNRMYSIGDIYKHHCETYGEPDTFGYKDFIPMFKAEHFNADEWAGLLKEAGAQFAGPVAEHHDGFSMWDSKVNRWNAKNMGPKRDIVGELEKAIRKQGMKFITTFHHANLWYYYYHMEGLDTSDPQYADLYGKPHKAANNIGPSDWWTDRPDKEFCDIWFAKLKEVIDNYKPDLLWFDYDLMRVQDKYKRKMAAYYFNAAEEWGKEVEIIYKDHHLVPRVGLLDYERGRASTLTWHPWVTDTILGTKSWCYIEDEVFKPITGVIHNLIDNISKNGYLLLNFGPRANGTIPDEVRTRLKQLGQWIRANQEAIFNSTPWVLAEEGPTKMQKDGGFSESAEVQYTEKDLRFVTKDNALYVFVLGWPGKELTIRSLTLPPPAPKPKDFYLIEDDDIESVHMLGETKALAWKLTPQGLKVQMPTKKPGDWAYTIKISWK